MKLDFKQATAQDIEKIINLCNECFFEQTSVEFAQKVYEETKNDSNQIYILGEVDGVAIAHAKITIVPTMYENMNTYAIINHFCVKEEYRRHGIATKMLEEINKISKEMKCKSIKLWSNNIRVPAHSCYKRNDFKIDEASFFSKDII